MGWLLSTLGQPSNAAVRRIRRKNVFDLPVLLWSGDGVQLAASYSPSRDRQGHAYDESHEPFAPYFFEIIVSRDEEDGLRLMAVAPTLDEEAYENLFADALEVGMSIPPVKLGDTK